MTCLSNLREESLPSGSFEIFALAFQGSHFATSILIVTNQRKRPPSKKMVQPSLLVLSTFLLPFLLFTRTCTSFSLTMSSSSPTKNHRNGSGGGGGGGGVVVVGSANQDLTAYSPVVPVLGQTVMGESFETGCGGKGANQANAAASLGIGEVTMVCRTGDDVFGRALLENFRRVGVRVDEAAAVLPQTSSGVATIVVDTQCGDNMIIVTPGANYQLKPEDVREQLTGMSTGSSGAPPAIVVVQLEILKETALETLKVAKEIGAITVLNPAPAPTDYSLDDFLPFTDILIPNESELRVLCGEKEDDDRCDEEALAQSLLAKGVGRAVIVTLGSRGAMLVEKKDDGTETTTTTIVSAPDDLPCRDDPVVDTIGAGDGFCGSLAAYLAAGGGDGGVDLRTAARLACGFAGVSVRRQGVSYPTAAELPDCLKVGAHFRPRAAAGRPALTFVTGNGNKLREVQKILDATGDLPFAITNQQVDLPELQGDPIGIAKEKCRLAAEKVKGPCFTEDTSLCFNALNGMPGPYIKWFLDSCGHDGLNRMLAGFDDRSAYAETVVAFTRGPGDEIHVFDGRTDGTIVPPRGSLEFGWDPIFETTTQDGATQTYAEMSQQDKNAISHRGKSFEKLRSFLVENADYITQK